MVRNIILDSEAYNKDADRQGRQAKNKGKQKDLYQKGYTALPEKERQKDYILGFIFSCLYYNKRSFLLNDNKRFILMKGGQKRDDNTKNNNGSI